MEPVKIRDDVDPESKEYRRRLIFVIMLVLGLSVFGGTCLGMKIGEAEQGRQGTTGQEAEPSNVE